MTTYRLMDGLSGRPGNGPSTGTAYSGPYLAGVMFGVTSGGMWFNGYYWWVAASGQDTTAIKCALWQITGSSSQVLVPGSIVTSGTLTAGAWNFIPLATPIALAPCNTQTYGALYLAAIGYSASQGFPETKNQFGTGDTYAAGITNGPLNAPSSESGSANPGSGYGGWTKPQMAFSVGGSDPSTVMPGGNDSDANFWVDVQVSDAAPSGASYQGFSAAPASVSPGQSAQAQAYTLGLEFTLSQACTLARIWHYSPSTATVLPTRCGIWAVSSQTVVSGTDNTSPAWKKQADGTTAAAGNGWVYCDYTGTNPALAASTHYKAATFTSDNTDPWFLVQTGWWGGTPGPFSSGVTSGPLTILGNSASTDGQDSWHQSTTWTYPSTGNISTGGTESPEFDGIDVEVTPSGGSPAGASGAPAALTLAAPAGTVTAGAQVTGLPAAMTLAGHAGTVSSGTSVTGTLATLTLAAPTGTVSTGAAAAGIPAILTLAAPAGSVSAGAVITGAVAALALGAPGGAVATGTGITGLAARLTLTALPGTVTAGAAIAGSPAVLDLAAPGGTAPSLAPLFLTASDRRAGGPT